MTLRELAGLWYLEGAPDGPVAGANEVVEACFSFRARAALLYPANLPARFFDLRSGEAGEILQKLRQYRIRLAVVCDPRTFSNRFAEMATEEHRGDQFRAVESTAQALDWFRRLAETA